MKKIKWEQTKKKNKKPTSLALAKGLLQPIRSDVLMVLLCIGGGAVRRGGGDGRLLWLLHCRRWAGALLLVRQVVQRGFFFLLQKLKQYSVHRAMKNNNQNNKTWELDHQEHFINSLCCGCLTRLVLIVAHSSSGTWRYSLQFHSLEVSRLFRRIFIMYAHFSTTKFFSFQTKGR